jgi:small subunit ribosomal protein S6
MHWLRRAAAACDLPRAWFDAIIARLSGMARQVSFAKRLSLYTFLLYARLGRTAGPPAAGAIPREGVRTLRKYELMFIMQPGMEEEALASFVESLQQVVTVHGGEVIKVDRMGLHKLAYPIDKHQQGNYVLMHANLNQEAMVELERELRLSENMLRYLLTRPPETE